MYNTARKYLVNTYNSEQETYIQLQIDIIQSAADNKQSAIAWDIVNKISLIIRECQQINIKFKFPNGQDTYMERLFLKTSRFQSFT